MSRYLHRVLLAGAIAASAHCAFALRPVPFDASPRQWELLAGTWRGNYETTKPSRHGLIEFRLKAAGHEAFGDVLMLRDRVGWPDNMILRNGKLIRNPELDPQLLDIRFVSADDRGIRGNLSPYWDPDRACLASASFLGSVDGDVITGSFTSVCEDGERVLEGTWRVRRERQR
jgi:hypothetical protein